MASKLGAWILKLFSFLTLVQSFILLCGFLINVLFGEKVTYTVTFLLSLLCKKNPPVPGLYLSIFLLILQLQEKQPKRGHPEPPSSQLPPPAYLEEYCCISRPAERCNLPSMSWVSQGIIPVGNSRNTSAKRFPEAILVRFLNHLPTSLSLRERPATLQRKLISFNHCPDHR